MIGFSGNFLSIIPLKKSWSAKSFIPDQSIEKYKIITGKHLFHMDLSDSVELLIDNINVTTMAVRASTGDYAMVFLQSMRI